MDHSGQGALVSLCEIGSPYEQNYWILRKVFTGGLGPRVCPCRSVELAGGEPNGVCLALWTDNHLRTVR